MRSNDFESTFFTLEIGYALHVLLSVNFSMRNPSSSSGFLYCRNILSVTKKQKSLLH